MKCTRHNLGKLYLYVAHPMCLALLQRWSDGKERVAHKLKVKGA